MSNDDDRQLAGEIEAALRALGIASRHGVDHQVEPFVRELRGGEIRQASDEDESGQQDDAGH